MLKTGGKYIQGTVPHREGAGFGNIVDLFVTPLPKVFRKPVQAEFLSGKNVKRAGIDMSGLGLKIAVESLSDLQVKVEQKDQGYKKQASQYSG